MGRQAKSSPVELLSRRNVGALCWSGVEAEEDPREMAKPVSGGAAGL